MHDKKCDLLWQTRIITEVYFFVVYVASDMLHMALVNLTINGMQIYSVRSPIHRLVPYQPPAYMVPAIDIMNSEQI